MKLKLNEKWSCGSNGHCKNLQKEGPIRNKAKPVNIHGKAKCLHNSGSTKCHLLMLCDKVSQKIKILSKKLLQTLKNAETGHFKCLLLRFEAIHLIKCKYFLTKESLLLLNLWESSVCLGQGRKKVVSKMLQNLYPKAWTRYSE